MADIGIDSDRRNKHPRLLTEHERDRLEEFIESIHYSSRYSDDHYEYRHVQLPKEMLKKIPKDYFDSSKGTLKLLWEEEWRGLGITQSLGWEHYEVHEPEPHILLFKYESDHYQDVDTADWIPDALSTTNRQPHSNPE